MTNSQETTKSPIKEKPLRLAVERLKLLQQGGDYLDHLKSGAKILPFAKMAG